MTCKPSIKAAALVCLSILATSAVWARGPSTEEERKQAVAITRKLEQEPFGKDAKQARAWLVQWIIDIPDIVVTACSTLLGPGFDVKKKYGAELFVQQTFAAIAFKIENPDKANDDIAVNVASVDSVLREYEAILAADPKARFESLDTLRQARDAGQLASRIAELSKSCHQQDGKAANAR